MRGRRVLQACSMAAGLALPALAQEPGRLELRVRDSRTGERVEARVREMALAPGRQLLHIESDGYLPLEAPFEPSPGATLPVTVWLDPVGKDDGPLAELAAGVARFEGRVFDARTGLTLRGARVRLAVSGIEAIVDAEGAFALQRPAPPTPALALPEAEDLVIEADGYVTQVRRAPFLVEGRTRWVIDLEPGSGAA